ncbi:MAG TPA: hypothetical protein VKU88_00020 [Acidimicrobiales bacterium]|nr:hypothetical protein [Acidimicrobiales bacterium]
MSRLRIVVAGWVAGFPTAGFLWHPLAFALGFAELGHEAWFLEDSGDDPWGYDPATGEMDPSCAAGIRFLAEELGAVGLGDRWCYRHAPTGRCHGLSGAALTEVLDQADLLVNVSLTTPMRPEYQRVPHRLAIDTDPVFTQVRIARGDPVLGAVPSTHTRLFTYGRPPLPAQAHEWLPTRQPVATRWWPVAGPPDPAAPLTSVTTWQAYPPVCWEGVEYAAKDRSFLELLDLPSRTQATLSLAMGAGIDHAEGASLLAAHGWQVTDPIDATCSTGAYRRYIAGSLAELGLAKHGYVVSRSGWFSERTCLYLASGRPAVVQDTGWTEWLPSGAGLLAFSTIDQAVEAIESVRADPAGHAAAARRVAETHFDAATVCQEILDRL